MSKIITPGSPHFNIHRRRYHEINVATRARVEGIFTCRAIKPGVGVVREATFKNLITNKGLDSLGAATCSFSRMHLGTGTTAPAVTDTALGTFGVNVQASNPTTVDGNSGSPDYYVWCRGTWTSTVGGATGTWTEIGISNQNTNGNLRSHALILDGGGSPTSFPVFADEQFQGTYELRIYFDNTDDARSVNISASSFTATTRRLRATEPGSNILSGSNRNPFFFGTGNFHSWYSGGLAATTASTPTGSISSSGTSSVTVGSYSNGTYQLDTAFRWGSGVAVSSSLRTVALRSQGDIGAYCGSVQVEYNPVIKKLTTEELILNQRRTWARL